MGCQKLELCSFVQGHRKSHVNARLARSTPQATVSSLPYPCQHWVPDRPKLGRYMQHSPRCVSCVYVPVIEKTCRIESAQIPQILFFQIALAL